MHTGLKKKKRGPGIKVTHTFTETQQWAGISRGETLCRMQFSPPFPSRKIQKPQNSWYWELLLEGHEEGPVPTELVLLQVLDLGLEKES